LLLVFVVMEEKLVIKSRCILIALIDSEKYHFTVVNGIEKLIGTTKDKKWIAVKSIRESFQQHKVLCCLSVCWQRSHFKSIKTAFVSEILEQKI
jgi:hypothetical protein